MSSIIGIDVSEHNGALDWAKIKAAGIRFAIIRTGYGTSHTDNYWKANITGATAQGIPVGVYHFSYALNVAGAKNEAAFVLSLLEPYKSKITLPVFFDFEYDTVRYAKKQGVTLGKQAFNDHTVAFLEAVKAGGYTPGVYYNLDYKNNYVDASRLGSYVQWYAQYSSKASWTGYDIWQYFSSYTISGVSGRFDVNLLADEGLLGSTKKYTIGWHKDDTGWWYADTETSYYKGRWAKINEKWYQFSEEGYMMANTWTTANNEYYYLGEDGTAMTGYVVGLDSEGKLKPIEPYYHLLSELPDYYRKECDKLIEAGKLKGKSGEGDNTVLDLPLSAIRAIIISNR